LLASAALAACGQQEEASQEPSASTLATQEQELQCRVNSQSLVDVPGVQRLTNCGVRAGWSLHSGDVNGDGLSDVVAGAPDEGANRGAVCLVLGNGLMDMTNVRRSLGDAGARAGYSVVLGDFAGSGSRVDLLAGGIGHSSGRGQAYGVDGVGLPSFALSSAAKYLGANVGDETGTALAVGDLTGDGLKELIVSAPLTDLPSGAPSNSGIVYIVKNTGAPPASMSLFSTSPNIFRIQNTSPVVGSADLRAGTSLAVADMNGDGTKDLAVGIPGYDGPAGVDSGAVFIFYGPLTAHRALSSADLKLVGASAGELAGTAIARVGDRNGDARDDLLVGAPGSGAAAGKAYLVHGGQPSGTVSLGSLIALTGSPGDRAGASVAAGDFNADGLPDMLIGAPGYQSNQGAVFLIHGDEPLLPSQALLGFTTLEGEGGGNQAGHSVSSAGDFNGDGVEDILIGAPHANGGQGTAYLIRGEAPRDWYEDADGDSFGGAGGAHVLDCVPPAGQWVHDNSDCNDADPAINPIAQELCSSVGIDDNCNGLADEDGAADAPFWAKDTDRDQHADVIEPLVQTCASPGPGYINNADILGYECPTPESDQDTSTYENAPEVCDTRDNNCNGDVDDGNAGIWYADVDRDGFGSDQEFFPYHAPCGAAPRRGYVNNKDDCNDRDSSLNPRTRWYVDNDGDGIGNNTNPYVESCTRPAGPYVRRNDDCNDADDTVRPGIAETCEPELDPQKDNNCNGTPDDTLSAITWFRDADGDGEGSEVVLGRFCGKPANSSRSTGDCDDAEARAFHGNTEVCEVGNYAAQVDNDCDGKVNDTPEAVWWYGDGDDDDYRGNVFRLLRCDDPNPGGVGGGDDDPDVQGEYLPVNATVDCNDADANATVIRTWYEDLDGNGCGNPSRSVVSCYPPVCGVPYATTSGPGCT
jgi:hypothetical protein